MQKQTVPLYLHKRKTRVGSRQSCAYSDISSNVIELIHYRFKLRLRPRTMALKMNGMRLSTLPRGKSAVEVFGDFLQYLFRCTRSFFIDTHANGQSLWHAVEHDIQLILSHPNGWEGAQQTKMRRAAVYGGLIPDTDEGRSRIRFVTEGEASLHACVLNGLAADVLSVSDQESHIAENASNSRGFVIVKC